jgi:DNA transformation protein and related proteins
MGKLSEMPNIGKELERRLEEAGIKTREQLLEHGSIRTFQLLHDLDPTACINELYALEGAVQNIRWHDLDKARKDELHHLFNMLKNK